MSDAGSPAPGWYPDPTQPGLERWWGGDAWGQETRAVESLPAPPPPAVLAGQAGAGPADGPHFDSGQKKSGCFGIASGVMLGIIGAIVLLVGGCTALIAFSSSSGDDLVSVGTTTTQTNADNEQSDSESSPDDELADDDSAADEAEGGSEVDDVISCTRIDAETIVLEVVNNSSKTSSYGLTIGYFDDGGQRLADEASFVNYLRPGERAIEEQFVFVEQGTVCEVLDVDRFATESIADEVAEVGECEIGTEADVLGDFQAKVSATNSSSETSDYSIDVAFVDSEGIRRGTGTAFIESVRSGETAPGDIFSATDFASDHSCQVVAVSRSAS